MTRPEFAINVPEHGAYVACGLSPSRFVVCQFLAVVVSTRGYVVDVEKITGHRQQCAPLRRVPGMPMMTPEEYLEQAERYRIALETVRDPFARQQLESMERSYRTLAESERALRKSGVIVDALDTVGDSDKAK
ncbi:hypothetical protein ACVIN2_000453 [Bradyrhizobium sp. USDA 3650]